MKYSNRKENQGFVVIRTAKELLEEGEKIAGFLDKPAADFGARTATQNHFQGGDISQDV